jgi:predicted PurR-regulated permease PerM
MQLPAWLQKLLPWLIGGLIPPLLALNGWSFLLIYEYFKTPISVLMIGTVLAFLLEYPVRGLQRFKIRRGFAILLVLLGSLLSLGFLGVTLVPLVTQQASQLTGDLSGWVKSGDQQIRALHDWAVSRGVPINLTGAFTQLSQRVSGQLQALSGRIPNFLAGAVGGILEVALTLIVTIYLLVRGTALWDGVFQWLPGRFGSRVRQVMPQSFHNYFMGQGSVALLLATTMTIAFLVFRVPYGVLFGVFIGLMALLPYGGSVSIIIVTLLFCLKSVGLGLKVLMIAVIVDQIIENGIAPRLLGELTGMHPVWVMMAVLVGGKIGGLLGVLLAVPLASFAKGMLDLYKPSVTQDQSSEA